MHKLFPTWYSVVLVSPDREAVQRRWNGIERFLSAKPDVRTMLELARSFSSIPVRGIAVLEGLRNVLTEEDPFFPPEGNDLEMRILAGMSVLQFVESNRGAPIADLMVYALLTPDFQGLHRVGATPGMVTEGEQLWMSRSGHIQRHSRDSGVASPEGFRQMVQELSGSPPTDVTSLSTTVGSILTQLMTDLDTLVSSANEAIRNETQARQAVEEEANIVWWLYGGYSRDLDQPFTEVGLPTSAVVGGKELADLVHVLPGPISAKAFLSKLLSGTERDISKKISLSKAINEVPRAWRESRRQRLTEQEVLELLDFCPLHQALLVSLETEGEHEWLPVFKKLADMDPDIQVPLPTLAFQGYVESLFLRVGSRNV